MESGADHRDRHGRERPDGGVALVEVSDDGGATWTPADGLRELDLRVDARRSG